ncbi:XRE family transcriptional regulator [Actinopolyspora erythraea]|uniref:XRE family transcriptional regulator n=1 Tax=Actinopolyspora erythraea TaxID=414996 RepID=A0A099D508_9ACTN|nr:helix-turn-helix transcriptional regulator [Actinopolyspora erythraea]ASU78937.1 XRE family transcriptional regulator [Actinopolyspora erythraea]KGI81278.1 hypothetical protein IL38_12390 [Actinopolyspora erythraea]
MGLGPTARRRRLGAHLAEMRESSELSVAHVAGHVGVSEQTLRNWERGLSTMRKMELHALCELYEASADVRETLETARRESSKRGWWSTYKLPTWFKPYIGLENDATLVRNFEQEIIPGLLQTEAYAREIHLYGGHMPQPDRVEQWVSARMQRQRRLYESSPLELRAVVSEAALRRSIGGEEVMAEQLQHIVKLAELPNVMFQVISAASGVHAGLSGGGFTVLSFEETDPDIGYIEGPLGGHIIEDSNEVTTLRHIFDEVRSATLSQRESVKLVRTMIPA